MNRWSDFERELKGLINRHSIDAETHTPDFVLAEMVVGNLKAYRTARVGTAEFLGQDLDGD